MRSISALWLPLLAATLLAQAPVRDNVPVVQVRRLNIISTDLPSSEALPIKRAIEGRSCSILEISERVKRLLSDQGYAEANAEIVNLLPLLQSPPRGAAVVSVRVKAGSKYHLSAIRFEHATAFPAEQLRQQFPIQDGALFNGTAIGKGLNNLSNLYESQGYINAIVTPQLQTDDAQHTLDLTLDIDEGAHYSFGRLLLDGVEPHAGAGKELLAAWSSVEDKTYDPKLLTNWLAANATFLPGVAAAPDKAAEKYVTAHCDAENHRVDIELHFP